MPSKRLTVPFMGAALLLYFALHSPLRAHLGGWFAGNGQCYFACSLRSVPWASLAPAVLALGLACVAAWSLTCRYAGPSYEFPLVWGVLVVGLLTVPAAVIGEGGYLLHLAPLRPPLGPLLVAVPSVLVLRIGGLGRRRALPSVASFPLALFALAAFLLAAAAGAATLHPPTGGDALSYHAALAVYFWRFGNLGSFLDQAPVMWTLAQPGTAELWFGLLRLAGGEGLADLGQLPFALLAAASVLAFGRRLGLRTGAALVGAAGVLLAPLVVLQSVMQFGDVAAAALLMSAVALTAAPVAEWTPVRLGLVGVALGLAAATKLGVLPGVVATGGFVIVVALRHGGVARRSLPALALFLVVVAPWWGRNILHYGNPIFPQALPVLGRGVVVSSFGQVDTQFVPSRLAWPLYPLVEPHDEGSGLGALFAVGVLPGLLLAVRRARRIPLLLFGTVVVVSLPAWWVFTQHQPRFLLAPLGLGLAFLPWTLLAVPRPARRLAAGLLAAAAALSALVTLNQAVMPLALLPSGRAAFYQTVWGVDPAAVTLPTQVGMLINTGYADDSYAAFYPLLGPDGDRTLLPVDTGVSGGEIAARMRSDGLQYAYVEATPATRRQVEGLYAGRFRLVHRSAVGHGAPDEPRRTTFRPVAWTSPQAILYRYLFRLRSG